MQNQNKRSLLPLPDVINPAQRRCVTFEIPDNLIHIGNFWGIIEKLGQWNTYARDPAKQGKEVAAVWRDIIEAARVKWLAEECGGEIEPGDCTGFNNCSGLITWFPQNPCTQPDYIPTGYILPPWFIVDNEAIPIAAGAKKGDVWTDLTRLQNPLSPPDPESGGAHLRFTFQNPTVQDVTVECHFVKVPSFGYALISQDDNPLDPLAELVDLNRDIASLPPETNIDTVIERHFVNCSVGSHHVDIGVVPYLDNEAEIPLHYGMCFRGIVLCGKDFGVPVPEIQFVDCTIRFRPTSSAAWQEFDISDCVRTVVGEEIAERLEDGELGGTQSPPQGTISPYFCKAFHVTLNANQRWLCPIPIKANYRITVTNAQGGASDGTINWYCPQSTLFGLGSCGSVEQPAQGSDPLQTQGHMRLIMAYDGTYYDAFNVDNHTVSSSLSGEKQLEFQVNDSPISDNSGSYQFDLEICNFGECAPVFEPADKNTVSYNNDEITIQCHSPNPPANGGYQLFAVIADADGTPCPCRALQIISLTGYQLPGESHNFNGGAVYPCGLSIIVNEKITGQNWQTFYNGLTDEQKCVYQFDIKSVTPFTITFKIVDCP